MRSKDLEKLAGELGGESMTSPVAITITLPTHRSAPENLQDRIRVKNSAAAAKAQTERVGLERHERIAIAKHLDELEDQVEAQVGYQSTSCGLACYITTAGSTVVPLGHQPPERIIISDTFSLAAPIADVTSADDLDIIVLTTGGGSTDGARHLRLTGGELQDAGTEGLPASYDIRDRNRARADKTESDLRDAHIDGFMREVSGRVTEAFGADHDRRIILAGVRRLRDHFKKVAPGHITRAIVAEIEGNLDKSTDHETAAAVLTAAEKAEEQRSQKAVELLNSRGRGRILTIHDDIHALAKEGRLSMLIVEEGAVDQVEADGIIIGDRIALTIRAAWDKNTDITIVPEGYLTGRVEGAAGIVAASRW